MKILFESAKEKREIMRAINNTAACPDDYGLENLRECVVNGGYLYQKCEECWEKALEGLTEVVE